MSVDIWGTNCDQGLSTVQRCFTSTETIRLIRMGSPRWPPQLSHSSWTLYTRMYLCCSLCTLYLHARQVSYRRWPRPLLFVHVWCLSGANQLPCVNIHRKIEQNQVYVHTEKFSENKFRLHSSCYTKHYTRCSQSAFNGSSAVCMKPTAIASPSEHPHHIWA